MVQSNVQCGISSKEMMTSDNECSNCKQAYCTDCVNSFKSIDRDYYGPNGPFTSFLAKCPKCGKYEIYKSSFSAPSFPRFNMR